MNIFNKSPLNRFGYDFIEAKYLPKGENEYYLRKQQSSSFTKYKKLTAAQINILIANNNHSDNWNMIEVSAGFNPTLVKNSSFFGWVRIGDLEPVSHEFHNFKMPEGIYNSTIISSDIGHHICIDRVNYMSHYIIGDEVMIANVNELATTDKAKFGNGILKDGEPDEQQRMVIEVCNENGGRKIIPFDGMLAGDAYLWSKCRDDQQLLDQFKLITEKKFNRSRGFYGSIGTRTVIKNCRIIKDTKIGEDAYIKGANKLKNLTINSDATRKSQIGEGCELVNGIIGYGCRIFYGVKAVRFIAASHSQLKYGARLINSYLGNNSTISCCEVLNSLIFPAHEQHHNNSFLCASLIMGQSNLAAGATIGSNHNSRGADGEIIAGRGFWPGLCVSLKHNSKFASFTILAKGDYPAELNVHLPFCLVSNDVTQDRLVIMPAYWMMYNMYALARNATKYMDRDKRTQKIQLIAYDYLAPDTIDEMYAAVQFLDALITNERDEALASGFENSKRPALITKVNKSKEVFKRMIRYHAGICVLTWLSENKNEDRLSALKKIANNPAPAGWLNLGGQLIRKDRVEKLKDAVRSGKINTWEQIHAFYQKEGESYSADKLKHAISILKKMDGLPTNPFNTAYLKALLTETLKTKQWITEEIFKSRAKDYQSEFRKMVYDNESEMNAVIGKLDNNSFIKEQEKELSSMKKKISAAIRQL
jgi:hypothetical protein